MPGEVLALGEIDSRLAADRGIDRCQKRRRYLDESDTAQRYALAAKPVTSPTIPPPRAMNISLRLRLACAAKRENIADCFKALVLLAVSKTNFAVYPGTFQRFERGF